MNRNITAIQRQFDRHADSYDAHAQVQRIMADQLLQFCTEWTNKGGADASNILEIGCGTGALTQALAEAWPRASITALDIAPAMLEAAAQRIGSAHDNDYGIGNMNRLERIQLLQANIELWAVDAPTASFDLIVSNACFQWLYDPEHTMGHLRRLLRPGGMLIFTTFGPDTFCELHHAFGEAYRAIDIEPQRHGLSYHSPDQWVSMLKASGFSCVYYERGNHMEKYASVRNFLQSVKSMGASTSEASPASGFSARQLFTNMYKVYEDAFSVEGGVKATYDLLVIRAS